MRTPLTRLKSSYFTTLGALLLFFSSSNQAATSVNFEVSSSLPSFTVAASPLGGISGCGINTGIHYYDSVTFRANSSASHTVETTALTGMNNDNFIAVYQGVFDPQNPTTGLQGCDDDSGPGTWARFSTNMVANEIYTGVVTSFGSGPTSGTGSYSVNPAVTLVYTVGGIVSGLTSGDTLVLQHDAPSAQQPTAQRNVTANGGFTFGNVLDNGNSYTVSIVTQPTGKTCTISNPSGTVNAANIRNIQISCTVNSALLSFDSQGGSAVSGITVNFGATQALPAAPQRANHTFNGWNTQANGSGTSYAAGSNFVMPSAATTLFAQWTLNSYAVTVNLSGDGGTVTPSNQTIAHGTAANFTLNASNKFAKLSSNCNASLTGSTITTAPITAACQITVTLYDKILVTAQNSNAAVVNESRTLSLSAGAGSKTLQQGSVVRAGRFETMTSSQTNAVLSPQSDGSYRFTASRTGRYQFDFTDATSGEQVTVSFDVLPYVAFTSSKQPGQLGLPTTLSIFLSDEAIDYPVTVKFQGTGLPLNLTELTIGANDNRRKDYQVTPTQAEKIQLSLLKEGVQNATIGTPSNHEVLLQTAPIPLALSVDIQQSNQSTAVVQTVNGNVRLIASQSRNDATTYRFTHNQLTFNVNGNIAELNPLTVAPGLYEVQVSGTDSQGRTGVTTAKFRIIETCPLNNCADTDLSGIPASVNSQRDFKERLPLCPTQTTDNRVSTCSAQTAAFIETPAGYQVSLGALSSQQSWSSGQFGVALNANSVPDAGFTQLGFKVNFDISGLENPGEAVPVVIPLPRGTTIPANAVWRKFIQNKWQNFVVDAANRVDSAARDSSGFCPSVAADSWQNGLNVGHDCIRLTIVDGGPNDNDRLVNSIVSDPGVLGVINSFTLSFNTAGAQNIASQTIAFEQAITPPTAPTRTGFTFTGWSPTLPATMPAQNVAVTATWQVNQYSLSFNTAGGSAIANQTIAFDSAVTAPAAPTRTGYTFTGWSPALPATMPAQNVAVTATWRISSAEGQSSGGSGGSMGVWSMLGLLLIAGWRRIRWCLLLLPFSGHASTQPWYGGLEFGHANTSVDAAKVQQQLANAGITAMIEVRQQSRAGYRAVIGYQLTPMFSVEAGWVDLAKIYTNFSQFSANTTIPALYEAMPQSGDGAEVSAVSRWQLGQNWQASLRLGAWHNRTEYQLQDPEKLSQDKQSSTRVVWGGALGYALSERWLVKLQFSQYHTKHYETRLWSAGAEFRF